MSEAVVAQKGAYPVDVEAGKTYYWCSCGRSSKQPFCDGSHKGSAFSPVEWTAETTGRKFFCGCKASRRQPFCDGSHSLLAAED